EQMSRAALQPKLRQRLPAMLWSRHAGIGLAVLGHRPLGDAQPLTAPETLEDALERGGFLRPANEAGPGGPAHLLAIPEVDDRESPRQGELLVDRSPHTRGPQRACEGDHCIREPAFGGAEIRRPCPSHAGSRFPPPSGLPPHARSTSVAI